MTSTLNFMGRRRRNKLSSPEERRAEKKRQQEFELTLRKKWEEKLISNMEFDINTRVERYDGKVGTIESAVKKRPHTKFKSVATQITYPYPPHEEGDFWLYHIMYDDGSIDKQRAHRLSLHNPNSKRFITED